ncbi:MAG TPA: adenylate/guanylate cyclase domain-containing protein, partial [Terriglobales bacterium]|nr:adenylate/guanylate cyclase domain-containing protein [Terriglobales bacterium]
EKDRDLRYQSAVEVCSELKRIRRDTTSNSGPAVTEILEPARVQAEVSSVRSLEIAHVLFMDVVAYSPLPMDEQESVLRDLQKTVRNTQAFAEAQSSGQLIALPTGDGMALVFFGDPAAPARCAVEISKALRSTGQRLLLRMGIHTGPVYRVADINANRNVAGGGINMAQRVMDCGDAGHILVSKAVADVLCQLTVWRDSLHDIGEAEVKHGLRINLYNLYNAEVGNAQRPESLNSGKVRRTSWQSGRRRWLAPTVGIGAVLCLVAMILFLRSRSSSGTAATPPLRWERLTNFDDAAEIPAVSSDGKLLAFLRGSGSFGSSTNVGQVWLKSLPNGEPIQLTTSAFRKQTLAFSPDGTGVYFTQVEGPFTWKTYELPLMGGKEPRLFMPNATGLSWIAGDRVLFSSITAGIHMKLVTSNASRTEERDVYVPPDHTYGMVHRSSLSPDGKWVLLVEMDNEWWKRCRVVPFDGSSLGRQVGPEGSCTWAQWSPDGKWMYFTVDTRTTGFHVWRQSFPDGEPQQLTPSGASEEEGLAMMPDGKSFITTSGTQQSAIWLHDDKAGDTQITSEGYSFLPSLSPDGKKIYYLRRTTGSHSYFSGELWVSDIETKAAEKLFSGLVLTHFSISPDGKKVVFATEQGQVRSGIWVAWLDRTQAPRQLTFGGEIRAFFGKPGEIVYQGPQALPKLMRINEDGSGQAAISDLEIMQLQNVSPDGRWALVGMTPPGSHGERNVKMAAVPLEGGDPVTVCDECSFGFGSVRTSAPLLSWSPDGKWVYVPLRPFPFGSTKTALIPVKPGAVPPTFTEGFGSEADFERITGARLVSQDNVAPGLSPTRFANTRRSAKANLFRVYLEQ